MLVRHPRLVASVLALAVCLRAYATEPGAAQKGPSWRGGVWLDPWRPIERRPGLAAPSPTTKDDEVHGVTRKEPIDIALETNPGIAARRLEPARLETSVLEA